MKDDKVIVLLLAVGVGIWYLSRQRVAAASGGYYGSLPSPTPTPLAPSPLGLNPGGGTNPLTTILSGVTTAFAKILSKGPGNSSVDPSTPASVNSGVQWPSTGTLFPVPTLNPNGNASGDYLPNLGDPNYAQWNTLGMVPDLSWTLSGDASYVPPPPLAGGGLPDLSWTLDPTSLGFDPNYIEPPPPPQGGTISIVGLG